jgi:two-component system, chemotaxis family, protein-glutamate methylesterase/glutaminase
VIRILTIDDSAFMRKALQLMLESDPEIKVIGSARDGEEGVRKVKELRPDIITLDIEMPRMGGLEALDLIMKEVPTPVLVVSSVTTEGAKVTLEALDRGAVDFIPKTQSFVAIDITNIKADLLEKIKSIAKKERRRRFMRPVSPKTAPAKSAASGQTSPKIAEEEIFDLSGFSARALSIGVSTGGPPVVQKIISSLPENFPMPVFIAQHMPGSFTKSFAQRLNELSKVHVKEAEDGEEVQRGYVYVGKGGDHLLIQRRGIKQIIRLSKEPAKLLYHPSADVLFAAAAEVYGGQNLSLILTGMGRDGVVGLREIHKKGGIILAQNEESCIVYGMPKAAVDEKLAHAALSIEGLIRSLATLSK